MVWQPNILNNCYELSGGYPPEPPTSGPRWGTFVPQTPCAPTSKSWLHHCAGSRYRSIDDGARARSSASVNAVIRGWSTQTCQKYIGVRGQAIYRQLINQRACQIVIRRPLLWPIGWLGSRVVSVLDSGTVGPGFKLQPRRCRVTVLGKLFTPIVPLFTKQQNW